MDINQFKKIINLFEDRVDSPDASYETIKNKKDTAVKVTLSGNLSAEFTRIKNELDRIETLKNEITKAEKELDAKNAVSSLFDAADRAFQCIVETKSAFLKIGAVKKETVEEVDYEQIVNEMAKELTPELRVVLEQIKKKFTKEVEKSRSPTLTRGEVLKESDDEESVENLALRKYVDDWAKRYNRKLKNLLSLVDNLG